MPYLALFLTSSWYAANGWSLQSGSWLRRFLALGPEVAFDLFPFWAETAGQASKVVFAVMSHKTRAGENFPCVSCVRKRYPGKKMLFKFFGFLTWSSSFCVFVDCFFFSEKRRIWARLVLSSTPSLIRLLPPPTDATPPGIKQVRTKVNPSGPRDMPHWHATPNWHTIPCGTPIPVTWCATPYWCAALHWHTTLWCHPTQICHPQWYATLHWQATPHRCATPPHWCSPPPHRDVRPSPPPQWDRYNIKYRLLSSWWSYDRFSQGSQDFSKILARFLVNQTESL